MRTQLQSQFGLFRLRYRFRSLGRRQFICHTRQSSVVAISKWQAGNPQLTMLVIILWCPWLLRDGPECESESESGYGYGIENKARAKPASEPNDQVHFGLYCSANLGAKSLDKGWHGPARTASPPPPMSFDSLRRESFAANRSNACTGPISRVTLTHTSIHYPLPLPESDT